MPGSPLSFASTQQLRNILMAKNLGLYSVMGNYTPPSGPLNYETVLGDSNVIDSPNNLNATLPNNYYPINEFGPTGGYSNTMALLNVLSNGPNKGPYLDSFVPSVYSPYSILLNNNPTGTDGSLSQDSSLMQLGAKNLKNAFQDRIDFQIYKSTVGVVNLQALQDPFQAALVATGQQPLIYRNWSITIPENPVTAAVDFATRLSGAYWPISFIPGDYFQENVNNGLPTSQTSAALNTANQLTGGLLGPVLNLKRNPSQIFLGNTGNGQKSALFSNLYYNRYRPNYDGDYGGILGVAQGLVNSISSIINPNGTVTSSYYVGSPNSEPGDITSPANQIPVNSLGMQVPATVYGPDELGKLYEGNIESLNFGIGGSTDEERMSVDGQFVWTSSKNKNNAGYHPTVGGGAGSRDNEFNLISSRYQSNESTNFKLKENSILDNTQRLIDSADGLTGPTKLKHVGNAINQVSKVFNDGYKEITKGSKVVSYTDNATGAEAGVEYCRVFAKDTPYYTYADLQKTEGITTSGRRFDYSVLDNTYNLNIAPLKGEGSTNIVQGGKEWNSPGGHVKKYMFSIENLAWRTSGRDGFKYDDLPICERGPNGGRVMWFPPYDIKFSDSSQANWNSSSFIGRPEPIYTYKDTSRSGNLSFKIVVDHPSVLNLIVNNQLKDANSEKVNSIIDSFFAGCAKFDLYTLAAKFNKIPVSELQQIQTALNNPRLTPEELSTLKKSIPSENTNTGEVKTTTDKTATTGSENQKACDVFSNSFNNQVLGFYFDNDIPKNSNENFLGLYNTYIGKKSSYESNAKSITFKEPFNQNTTPFFDDYVVGNFNKVSQGENSFIEQAFNLLEKNISSGITVTMVGSASAIASNKYNKSLSLRRISSVKEYFKTTKLGKYMQAGNEKFKVVSEKGEGEDGYAPYNAQNVPGQEIKCTTDIKNSAGQVTNQTQIYSVSAMACRSVRINEIKALPIPDAPKEEIKETTNTGTNVTTTETTIVPIKPQPKQNVSESLKKGLSKKVLRALLSECDYFDMIKENDPITYNSFKEKIKYFTPAFHAITPEGLNSRLTFLNQCVRPGETIPIIGPDGKPRYNDSLNTSFGAPPVLILRIGDFYNTKIIPNNVSFSYEPLMFDMNPEGIGVQPMLVDVQLSFNIIGGMGLKEPVEQLQNALSFNFYANTEIYDERSQFTDNSFEALDKQIFDSVLANSDVKNQTVNNQQQKKGGKPIGEDKKTPVNSGETGEIVYQVVMDKLLDVSKNYFENIFNQLEKTELQYNYGIVQLLSDTINRSYRSGNIGGKNITNAIYGKPDFSKNIDTLFTDVINEINSGLDPITINISGKTTPNNAITLKQNIIQFIRDMKGNFESGLTGIVQDIVKQEMDLLTYIRELNLIYDKTDGYLKDAQTPVVYNLSGSTKPGDTVTPGVINDTYTEFSNDYKKFAEVLPKFLISLQSGDNGKHKILNTNNFVIKDPLIPLDKIKLETTDSVKFYLIMARILSDDDKKQNFISTVLTPNISSDKKLVKTFNKICNNLQDDYIDQLDYETKQFDKFKKSDEYTQYIDGLTELMYIKGKPRRFIYSTDPGPNNSTQEQNLKNIYGTVNYGTGGESFDGIIKM